MEEPATESSPPLSELSTPSEPDELSSRRQSSMMNTLPPSASVLENMEVHTRALAGQLDGLMATLHFNLHRMSSLTLDCTSVQTNSINLTCDSVDASIKNTYSLMAKCEELSRSMSHLEPLEKEIEAVKRTLDMFEKTIRA